MRKKPAPGGKQAAFANPLKPARSRPRAHADRDDDDYGPVPLRYRYDGWTPDRQFEFIERLAECGCVDEAAQAVGMGRASAYALKRRADAQAFRLAWEAALDFAVGRVADAALGRAIHGVPVPIFHDGVQIGERRHFDERLTMFVLRCRDPARHGKWIDRGEFYQQQDGPLAILYMRIGRMLRTAHAAFNAAFHGEPAPPPGPEHTIQIGAVPEPSPGTRH